MPVMLLVMGVSGAGKTVIGRALAVAIGARFIEGDEFHPEENREKMRCGLPLDDADRQGWLSELAARLAAAHRGGESVVLACSALKQSYRDRLAAGCPGLRTIWLHGSPVLIASRLAERTEHFMPASLLNSQLETLEPPVDAMVVDISQPPPVILSTLVRMLQSGAAPWRDSRRTPNPG